MAPRVVVIDGLIGAGKSTLLALLADVLRARGLRVAVAPEPVAEWRASGALPLFYSDPARYAVEFQMYVFATRVRSIRLAMTEPVDVVLLERSVLTDRGVFFRMAGASAVQQAMYDAWCDEWMHMLPFDLRDADFVHLRPTLAACMARVRGRARAEELGGGVTEEYQQRLRATYAQFFADLAGEGCRVHAIDDDADYRQDPTRTQFCAALIKRLGL